ncbi:hypothetical protein evm_012953 [Chilo suppressalis]|nr:hypothetical protein evm_012953 [Chilo suppressalis]
MFVDNNLALWFICFLISVHIGVSSQFRFDYTYNVKAAGWVKLHEVPASFHDAFRRCNAEGAVLASPLNIYLKNAMTNLHKKTKSDACALYTGIHATISKGAYTSIEGVPLNRIPTTWAPDEPDNHNDSEDCIVILQNGTMADVRCTETFPYVCYKKKTKTLAINDCGTIDNEYILDHRTGSCYKFHKVGKSWKNAYMTCIAEGGHLAVINSATEVEVIKDVFARVPAKDIFSKYKDVASVGYYDWGEFGVFYTVHGETLKEAGYSKFGEGNPDNGRNKDGDYICGAVARDGLYYDVWCNIDIAPFICEKKPESLLNDDE